MMLSLKFTISRPSIIAQFKHHMEPEPLRAQAVYQFTLLFYGYVCNILKDLLNFKSWS